MKIQLSALQEWNCIRLWKSGDTRKLAPVLTAYQPFLRSRAGAYHRRNQEVLYEDLFQAATVGLLGACRDFNPERGARLVTPAEFYVKTECSALLYAKKATTAHLSNRTRALWHRLSAEAKTRGYRTENLLPLQAKELGEVFGTEAGTVLAVARHMHSTSTTLDSFGLPSIPASQLEAVNTHDVNKLLTLMLNELPERERLVLEFSMLKEPKLDLAKIGLLIGVSGERVRQIREDAYDRMRAWLLVRGIEYSDLYTDNLQ